MDSRKRWQFSVRALLLLTAVVAAVLSLAVQLPMVFQALLIVASIGCLLAAAMWTAGFATPETRPLLAACTWLVFGAFFSHYTAFVALLAREYGASAAATFGLVLVGVAAGDGRMRAGLLLSGRAGGRALATGPPGRVG